MGENEMDIKKVMVIGAGQMGGGIAQVCAQAGYEVLLNDIREESFNKGLAVITKNLVRNVEKERMTEEEKQQQNHDSSKQETCANDCGIFR